MRFVKKDAIRMIVLWLLSLIILFPLLLILFGSFKSRGEAALFTLSLPSSWDWSSYGRVITDSPFFRSFKNSVIMTTISTGLVIATAAPAALVLARKARQKKIKIITLVFMLGIVAPISIIPTIVIIKFMKIYGTQFSGILIYTARFIPFSIFLLTGFFKTIPREMDEASIIDGCHPIRMIIQVMMPLLRSILLTCIIFISMNVWNDFQIPIFFFSSSEKWTMPLLVYNFFGKYMRQWNLVFACLILTALPITTLYLTLQKYIVSGMTQGAVKG